MSDQRKLRILVIDDEVTQRMLVKDYLEEAGHVVRQADDGRRGLKMATTTAPDVILLDVMLPSIDGFDLCRSLKQHPVTAHTPVILITASRDSDVISKGLAAGADDFITKPVDWNFLVDRVEHVTRKSQERTQLLQIVEQQQQQATPPSSLDHLPPAEPLAAGAPAIEELMRSADLQSDHATSSLASEIASLKADFEDELARGRAENERLVLVARAAVKQAQAAAQESQTAAEQAHQAEVAKFRDMLEKAHALSAEREQADRLTLSRRTSEIRTLREALDSERLRFDAQIEALNIELKAHAARHSTAASWSNVSRALAWQSTVSASLTTRIQAALASPGKLDPARLTEIDRTAQTLASAIGNAKRFAHAIATADTCKSTAVNIPVLLSQIAAQARNTAINARVDLRAKFQTSQDPKSSGATAQFDALLGDEQRLRYAWICLVVNAIRATPAGGQVILEAATDDRGDLRLQVTDTGIGIAPAKLDELRTSLDGVATGQQSQGPTAGLGLAMASALARQMGGSLELVSQLGRGTRAALVFPKSQRTSAPVVQALAS